LRFKGLPAPLPAETLSRPGAVPVAEDEILCGQLGRFSQRFRTAATASQSPSVALEISLHDNHLNKVTLRCTLP
jgi:hypothetical protein